MNQPQTNTAMGCPYSGNASDAPRPSEWSPAQDETFGSAHHEYAELRRENPFPWSSAYGGFWAATTYEDILRITQDDELFSTATQNVVPHVPRSSRRPPLHFDPPEHTEYRNALDPVFRRSIVREHHHDYVQSAQRLIGELLESPEPDAVRDFAAPFVMECFATLMGVSQELTREIRRIGVNYSFAIQDMDEPLIARYSQRLYSIAEEIYTQHPNDGRDPRRDLVASLKHAVAETGNNITEKTAIATIRQLIVAGMGAPQAVLGSAIVHLAQDQQLQQRLRTHPEDLPSAIEEFLRLHAPYRVFARTPKHDTVIHGRKVSKDEPIALIFPSANRDANQFDRPDDFVLHRKQNSHVAFGRGAHRCPAASLGRMELLVALQVLLESTSAFELSGEVVMMNWLEYGPRSVPISLSARNAKDERE